MEMMRSGRRGKSFHQLPPQEQAAQREEAYARATVALTRAQEICFIMGPLDVRGLVGAATTEAGCFPLVDIQSTSFVTQCDHIDICQARSTPYIGDGHPTLSRESS